MIICPECSSELQVQAGRPILRCHQCSNVLSSFDHTLVFHPQLSGIHDGLRIDILDEVFHTEENHFWMRFRRMFIYSIFKDYVKFSDSIMEIGAGTGSVANYLIKKGYKNLSIGDVHIKALDYAKKYGIQNRYQFDLMEPPFIEHFDAVCLFDVLEHLDDDETAIINIRKMLKMNGKLILTVPAHMWLWSRQDAIASHRKRYELNELKEMLNRNEFRILKSNYFFVTLVPFLWLRRYLNPDKGKLCPGDFKNRFAVHPWLNYLLTELLLLEKLLLKKINLKFGGSIIVVAEKRN
jgi:SAM-dependent methyltransferase